MTKPNQTNDGLVSFLQLLVPRCHQKSVLGHTTTKPNLECPRRHQPWTGHWHCNASVPMYSLICILASLQCQHRSPVFHFYRLELRVICFAGFARQVVYHNRCKMSHYIMTHTMSHRCDGYVRLKSDNQGTFTKGERWFECFSLCRKMDILFSNSDYTQSAFMTWDPIVTNGCYKCLEDSATCVWQTGVWQWWSSDGWYIACMVWFGLVWYGMV